MLFTLGAAAVASATDACDNVQFSTEQRLEMGTVRVQPGATGFIELDPREGIALSNSGVTHQGPFGPGITRVLGPIGATLQLDIEAIVAQPNNTRALQMVELIVRVGSEQHRMPLSGESFVVTLPSNGNEQGIAQTQIIVGAVFRYEHFMQPQTAGYRLAFRCITPKVP
jgi:hypothetical protein